MTCLLDNDVFFAALNQAHEAHRRCRSWLDRAKPEGWAIAVETHLAALRLLMNPSTMAQCPLTADQAFAVVEAERSGAYPARLVFASAPPSPAIVGKARGHKQIMDFWLVQLARENRMKLATMDAGTLANWPGLAQAISAG